MECTCGFHEVLASDTHIALASLVALQQAAVESLAACLELLGLIIKKEVRHIDAQFRR